MKGEASEQTSISVSKEEIRRLIWDLLEHEGLSARPHGRIPPFEGQNRAAERLRRWPLYARARCLMVPPDEALFQVRFNALKDRKRLLLASPGLREGFFVLTADSLPPRRWLQAVRAGGIARFGRRVSVYPASLGKVDLVITGAVAVDPSGGRLGKGKGFFDLEYAILRETGSISQRTPVVVLVHEAQLLPSVPMEEGDVPVDWIITPDRIVPCSPAGAKPGGILWERVSSRDLRRIRPLWELSRRRESTVWETPGGRSSY